MKLPGREICDYRQALRYSEAACQLEPEKGAFLTTLGVAHYRAGDWKAAVAALCGKAVERAANRVRHRDQVQRLVRVRVDRAK